MSLVRGEESCRRGSTRMLSAGVPNQNCLFLHRVAALGA